MITFTFTRIVVSLVAVAGVLAPLSAHAALRYRLTLLAHPPEYEFTTATSISEDGRIGGTASGFGRAAVYWSSAAARVVRVTGTGADCSDVSGINSSGMMVGTSMEGFYAYRWQPGGDLQILSGTSVCCPRAEAINDSGAAVGRNPFDVSMSSDFAALWVGDTVQNLGAAPGHVTSIALDISNAGHIVGRSQQNAARWVDGDCEVLAGLEGNFSFSNGVNNHGDIVGEKAADGPVGFSRPFAWRDGVLTELPLLGGNFGVAQSINDAGVIVGMSSIAQPMLPWPTARAVAWRNDQVLDLNTRVINMPADTFLIDANDINSSGQIVGVAAVNMKTFILDQAFFLDPIAPADVTADGAIDVDDLIEVILGWGPCLPAAICHADVVEDSQVNADDLTAVILAWR